MHDPRSPSPAPVFLAGVRATRVPAMLALFALAASLTSSTQLSAATFDAPELSAAAADAPHAPAPAVSESPAPAAAESVRPVAAAPEGAGVAQGGSMRKVIRFGSFYWCLFWQCDMDLCCQTHI